MSVMRWSIEEGIAELTFTNGENRHNPQFLAEFHAALDAVEADPSARALILASDDPKCWSLGIDLNWIMAATVDPARHDEVRGFLNRMNDLYKRVLTYPMPVITAMAGHVFGNGAIFSCACDFRFMLSNRGFFCFPEVDVSIPFLPGMFAVVKKAVPPHLLNELAISGRRVGGKEALENHIVSGIFDSPEDLRRGARVFAQSFNKARGIFREQKLRNYKWIFEVIDRDDPPLIAEMKLVV